MKWTMRTVWSVFLALTLAAATLAAGPAVTDVTVAQAGKLTQERSGKPDFMILDVRTPGEFADGHLVGAVNIDVQAPDFEMRVKLLDRARTYLVYCRTGNRSRRAVQAMERLGFRSILHMTQGIVGWQEQKLPVFRPS